MSTALTISNNAPQPLDELLGTATIAAICNVEIRAVQLRLKDLTPDEIGPNNAKRWRQSRLPADYIARIELAKAVKGYACAEDILDWSKRAEALFHWRIEDLTNHEKRLWPHRKSAVLEYYRSLDGGLSFSRAEERACDVWRQLTGDTVTTRTIRNWVEPVERCGGPEHAPDVAFTIWKRGKKGAHIPQATIDFFIELLCENQRKFRPAYRKLMKRLEEWRETRDPKFAIPGYPTPPPNAKGKCHPHRWTYAYLAAPVRRPRNAVIVASRQGSIAAAAMHSIVRRTREDAKVGQFYVFDDSEYDQKTNLPSLNTVATRPLGLDALDYASACVFASAFKPILRDEVTAVKKMLREWDMVWFVIHVLQTYGFRVDADGTFLVVELGTASISKWFEENLDRVTDGKVRVWRSRSGGDPAFAGVFEGARKGNPRFKAALESSYNRRRNDMADQRLMPGQVGMDADHQPEEITGRDRYNRDLLRAWSHLSEDQRAQFQFPYQKWSEFVDAAITYIEAINRDPEHELEGWKHRTVQEWRMDESLPWLPRAAFDNLPADKQAIASLLLEANPNLVRERKRSRREEMTAGLGDLVRLPDWDVESLLTNAAGKEFGKFRTVTADGYFRFKDEEVDPYGDEFVFLARVFDRHGHEVSLTEGGKYLTYLNPFAPGRLIVCRTNGGYLGSARAIDRARFGNAEEEAKLLRLHRDLVTKDKTDLQRIGAERIREQAAMVKQNAGVAAPGAGARDKQQREAARGLSKLYADD